MMIRRLTTALLLIVLIILVAAGTEVYRTYGKVRNWSDQIYEPLHAGGKTEATVGDQTKVNARGEGPARSESDQSSAEDAPVLVDERKPFTILLMGVDRRKGDKGRADTLIAAAVNPQKHSTVVVSIPRDTRTEIAGKHRRDKINHAYAFGGIPATVETVEQTLGISIDYYVKVNMEGFRDIVDLMGGVSVSNDRAFQYEGHSYEAGELSLNGEEALGYVRMRYEDPKGDIGRGDRQKAVLRSILNKLLNVNGALKLSDLFDSLADHMKTNLTFEDWKTLVFHYRDAADNVQVEQLTGHGIMLDGIYYYSVPDEEMSRVGRIFADWIKP